MHAWGVIRQHRVLRRVLRRFWEGLWGRVLKRALRRGPAMGFTVNKGPEKGSQKGFWEGVSRRCLERPLAEYAPLGVRPIQGYRRQQERYSPQSSLGEWNMDCTYRFGRVLHELMLQLQHWADFLDYTSNDRSRLGVQLLIPAVKLIWQQFHSQRYARIITCPVLLSLGSHEDSAKKYISIYICCKVSNWATFWHFQS